MAQVRPISSSLELYDWMLGREGTLFPLVCCKMVSLNLSSPNASGRLEQTMSSLLTLCYTHLWVFYPDLSVECKLLILNYLVTSLPEAAPPLPIIAPPASLHLSHLCLSCLIFRSNLFLTSAGALRSSSLLGELGQMPSLLSIGLRKPRHLCIIY